jgi:hypothetical protein
MILDVAFEVGYGASLVGAFVTLFIGIIGVPVLAFAVWRMFKGFFYGDASARDED